MGFTVPSERYSRPAISALVRPWATNVSPSRSRSVTVVTGTGGVVGATVGAAAGVAPMYRSSRRRVTDGATTASPRATTGIAVSRSGASVSLSRNPLAPA